MRLRLGARTLDLATPKVMGVINVTPDSFSDGGRHAALADALAAARRMVAEGADLIDVGGESTRPGAAPVPEDEELARVVPVIEALVAELPVPVSVDTCKPGVMRAAVDAGATLINSVDALRTEGALATAASLSVAVCLMHMRGEPRTMQRDPAYRDVVAEVRGFLAERIAAALGAGLGRDALLVDPGFGFGKTLEHNLALFEALPELAALGPPLLVGVSRKAMVGAITGRPVEQRAVGSAVAAALAVGRGARVVRVHDVGATRDALAIGAALGRGERHRA
jgi:dihydropteroate synthase